MTGGPPTDTRWTEIEKRAFIEGLSKHGKDWRAISELVGSKTHLQCRTYYNNCKRKQNFDSILGKEALEAKVCFFLAVFTQREAFPAILGRNLVCLAFH